MQTPARSTLAIIGAGPIGLEAAAAAVELGLDVHVFERGEVGDHLLAWGHVGMFTPWRMVTGPASARLLARNGGTLPDPETLPTGRELVEWLLQPLARTPELRERVHTHAQVLHVARRGALKGEWIGAAQRRDHPFRIIVRDAGGREQVLHAFAVIDASGTYGSPNWAGTGGIPARQESYLAPQMSYHCDDVLGLRRERHAGKRTLVVGGGLTAATTVLGLAQLAAEVPGTTAVWVTRAAEPTLTGQVEHDPLPARARLVAEAQRLMRGEDPAIGWTGGAEVEGFEYNSATHRYRVALTCGDAARIEEADQVIVNCGFGPDNGLYRELQVHECYGSRGPMALSAALLGAGGDCMAVPATGLDQLRNPEPDFYILGAKSYARYTTFLLERGFEQVAQVTAQLATDLGAVTTN
jgi:thioredoxin reductase